MKKTLAFLLAIIMLLSVAACGQKDGNSSNTDLISSETILTSGTISLTESEISSMTQSNVTSTENPTSSDIVSNHNSSTSSTTIPESEKFLYEPDTITLSLCTNNSYGVTWQTSNAPITPVVQVSKGSSFNESNCTEYTATYRQYSSYEYPDDISFWYYVVKAEITGLVAGQTYTYRCYDKGAQVGSYSYTFTALDSSKTDFKFVHVSDSQVDFSYDGNLGKPFNNTLKGIDANGFNPSFILHTGDMVEWSKYETSWSQLINYNEDYFTSIPFAVISGNHEASYRNGKFETFKHFNYKFTEQDVTKGIYYSFDYGNARFIMLDTNTLSGNKLPDAQYNWLVSLLKNNTQKWTIVSMHNPMYSVGKYGSDSTRNGIALALREQLGDIFAEYGVDLVLQGHDHEYSKTYPIGIGGIPNKNLSYETIDGIKYVTNANGVTYIMNGPAGNQSRTPVNKFDSNLYEFVGDSSLESSWAEIHIKDNLLSVEVYSYNNGSPKLWKSYGLKK